MSPDGMRLASVGSLDGHFASDFASGGSYAVGEPPKKHRQFDRSVRVWDVATGREILSFDDEETGHKERSLLISIPDGHPGFVTSAVFSPDGQRLASASFSDQIIKVWDAATGQRVLDLRGHTGDLESVQSVVFSPDGRRLASAGQDRTIKLWDAATGQEILTLSGHTGPVTSVAFSPDGQSLASASADGTVRVWGAKAVADEPNIRADSRSLMPSPPQPQLR